MNEVPRLVRHLPTNRFERGNRDHEDEQSADGGHGHVGLTTGVVADDGPQAGAIGGTGDDCRDDVHCEKHGHALTEVAMPHEHLVETKVTFERAGASDEHHTKQAACRRQQTRELREREPAVEPVARERRNATVPSPQAKHARDIRGGDDPYIGAKQRRRARTRQGSCRATLRRAGAWSLAGVRWHGY